MKLKGNLFVIVLLALVLTGSNGLNPLRTELYNYSMSTDSSESSFSIELPVGTDAVSSAIRNCLLNELSGLIRSFEGVQNIWESIDLLLKAEAERLDETSKEHELHMVNTVNLKKVSETRSFVVFNSGGFKYSGGAHGGSMGLGHLTFDRRNGKQFSDFLRPDCIKAIQPLLREGLCRYYASMRESMSEGELMEHLFIEGSLIPLPRKSIFPADDGLGFEYCEYEIACYADGTPSFVIPYRDIRPFMTVEAMEMLGLK